VNRMSVYPAIVALVLFLGINCLAGYGLGLLVAETNLAAVLIAIGLPSLSLLALGALWLQFRRRDRASQG
jgi:hypothetical protein